MRESEGMNEQPSPTEAPQPQTIPIPYYFHLCSTDILANLVTGMMSRLITHNDRIPLTATSITRFHSRAPPGIKLDDYLRRIIKFAGVEPSVLILLLVYIDRVCEIHRNFTISSLTVHRFIIAAVTVGSKATSDIYCTNTYYAKVGGISLQELNMMELELCALIDWRFSCSVDILQRYYLNLARTNSSYILGPVDAHPVMPGMQPPPPVETIQ
ncbi:cyclin-domain-containing protein [Phlyctochytrium arcticum]|nr:cyclin-domain-containing protein [Phlyctochytrium arcticum]